MAKITNAQMNSQYPCLVLKRGKGDEFGDLYEIAAKLRRPVRAVFEMMEAYNGHWYTANFEVHVEDDASRIRRAKEKGQWPA